MPRSAPIPAPAAANASPDAHYDPAICPVARVLSLIGGRWTLLVICRLKDAPLRYGELRRRVPGVSERMLIQTLRTLETSGMVVRTAEVAVPPRVEYRLSAFGDSLTPVLDSLLVWGLANLPPVPGGPVAAS